jgi:hypothetical protein
MYKHVLFSIMITAALAGCGQQDANSTTAAAAPKPAAATPTTQAVSIKPLPPASHSVKPLTEADAQRHLAKKYDQDGDGRVALREMLAQALAQQMSADSNHDGQLSAEEFHGGLGDMAGRDPVIQELFKALDENKNGVLDEQEIARRAWAGIVPLDANHDGFIDASESRAVSKSTE